MKQTDAFSMIHKTVKLKIRNKNKPIRIAVNGIEGTGKTTFAVNFVEYLKARNVAAFHVSIDGFHFNKRSVTSKVGILQTAIMRTHIMKSLLSKVFYYVRKRLHQNMLRQRMTWKLTPILSYRQQKSPMTQC